MEGSQSKEGEDSSEGLRVTLIPKGRGVEGSRGKIKEAEISRGSSSLFLGLCADFTHTYLVIHQHHTGEMCLQLRKE